MRRSWFFLWVGLCWAYPKDNALNQPTPKAPPEGPSAPTEPAPKEPVSLRILSPREGEVISSKGPAQVTVSFELKHFEIQPDGQHLYVILDNNPYELVYDATKPFTLKAQASAGTHTLRAFPGAGPLTEGMTQHETIKDPTAFAMTTFVVGKPDGQSAVKQTDPILTLARPKGEYVAEKAKKILLDFWVKNATIAPDQYKVRYKVDDGNEVTLTEWKKAYIEGLGWGDHTLEVWLVGPDGKDVGGPFTRVKRKIALKEVAEKSLFERLGGQAVIEAVVIDFLRILAQDTELNKRFKETDLNQLQERLSEQLCELSGGPCKYSGKGMSEAHAGMKIKEKEFTLLLKDLTLALDKNKVPEREKKELLTALSAMKDEIVTK